jgi:hypothetical protein
MYISRIPVSQVPLQYKENQTECTNLLHLVDYPLTDFSIVMKPLSSKRETIETMDSQQ